MYRIEMLELGGDYWVGLGGPFTLELAQRTIERWRKSDARFGEMYEYRVVPYPAEG